MIVDLAGRLIAGTGDELLRELINRLLAENRGKILLNLANVAGIDSSGVGELVASKKIVEHFGGALKLLEAKGNVAHVLDAGLLLPLFEHFTDEAAAVKSFR